MSLKSIIASFKHRDRVMRIVQFIEMTIPDGTPGLTKLDMALKLLIKADAKLEALRPQFTEMIADAKAVYNAVNELTNEVQAP